MISSLDAPATGSGSVPRAVRLVELVTILGWILLAGVVGSWYVGHSTSPYGACYAASGRQVPCRLTARR
jgi:hypothetical protein